MPHAQLRGTGRDRGIRHARIKAARRSREAGGTGPDRPRAQRAQGARAPLRLYRRLGVRSRSESEVMRDAREVAARRKASSARTGRDRQALPYGPAGIPIRAAPSKRIARAPSTMCSVEPRVSWYRFQLVISRSRGSSPPSNPPRSSGGLARSWDEPTTPPSKLQGFFWRTRASRARPTGTARRARASRPRRRARRPRRW
jgi:hypothetical protein